MAGTDSKGSNARIIVELRANHGNVASYANPSNRGARSSSAPPYRKVIVTGPVRGADPDRARLSAPAGHR